jgi:hypothetical protein
VVLSTDPAHSLSDSLEAELGLPYPLRGQLILVESVPTTIAGHPTREQSAQHDRPLWPSDSPT